MKFKSKKNLQFLKKFVEFVCKIIFMCYTNCEKGVKLCSYQCWPILAML